CHNGPARAHVSCGAHALGVPMPSSRPASLAPCYPRGGRGHPLQPCLRGGDASHTTAPHCVATNTTESWSGYARPPPAPCAVTSRRDKAETSPEPSATATACSDASSYW